MLGRTCTVTHRSQTGSTGRYNEPEWTEDQTEGVAYARQQRTESEDLDDRQTQLATHKLFFAIGVELDGSDTVSDDDDGMVLEIIGPPRIKDRPDGPHHIEASAREIDQREVAS